jgi:hypothetical protein
LKLETMLLELVQCGGKRFRRFREGYFRRVSSRQSISGIEDQRLLVGSSISESLGDLLT